MGKNWNSICLTPWKSQNLYGWLFFHSWPSSLHFTPFFSFKFYLRDFQTFFFPLLLPFPVLFSIGKAKDSQIWMLSFVKSFPFPPRRRWKICFAENFLSIFKDFALTKLFGDVQKSKKNFFFFSLFHRLFVLRLLQILRKKKQVFKLWLWRGPAFSFLFGKSIKLLYTNE